MSQPPGKSLTLILSWLEAKQSHVEKYCKIYTDLGIDVLLVQTNVLKLLRPTTGTQVIAKNVVDFLTNNENYEKLFIHGFSVGGYLWGECLLNLYARQNFEEVTRRFKGQVWDSGTGIEGIPIGASKSLFPENESMQKVVKKLLELYLENASSMKHYVRSADCYHNQPLQVPALVFTSKIDFVATERYAGKIADSFRQQKVDVTLKCFENAPHIKAYHVYREEYIKCLADHWKKCKIID